MEKIIFIIATIVAIGYIVKVRGDFDKGLNVPEVFSIKEKIAIWVFCLLSPFLFGAIFYYSLKSRLPKKAKYANNVSWAVIVIMIGSVVAYTSYIMN